MQILILILVIAILVIVGLGVFPKVAGWHDEAVRQNELIILLRDDLKEDFAHLKRIESEEATILRDRIKELQRKIDSKDNYNEIHYSMAEAKEDIQTTIRALSNLTRTEFDKLPKKQIKKPAKKPTEKTRKTTKKR